MVRSVVHSFAAHHRVVLQQISGGLDSSIVLGCLGDAPHPPDVICYTDFVPGSPSDERRWARCATARRGWRHVEVCRDPKTLIFAEMAALAPSVEPSSCFSHWQRGPVDRRLAGDYHASATMTGEGGDTTFGSTAYVLAVDDSLRRCGIRGRTWRTAVHVAARRDLTVWMVLGRALRRRLFGTSMREHRTLLAPTLQLASAEAMRSGECHEHFPNPWFSSSAKLPLESLSRLGTLAFSPNFYDLSTSHHNSAPCALSPLCAQPVVEVAARIPMDILFADGRIRGLARRAFSREVPEPILRRQWKDRPFRLAGEVIQRNLNFIREALLDGALMRERILDRSAVELALRGGPTVSRAVGGEIMRHLDLELWIRHSL